MTERVHHEAKAAEEETAEDWKQVCQGVYGRAASADSALQESVALGGNATTHSAARAGEGVPSLMPFPRCPECGSMRLDCNGMRYTKEGQVQRYLCQECGHRPSFGDSCKKSGIVRKRQVGALAKAKNLTEEPQVERLAGENQQLTFKDARITQYAWKCKLKGLQVDTIERRCYLLQRLVNNGGDLGRPESIDETLAINEYPLATKWLMVSAYKAYCKVFHLLWDPPRVKYQPKAPYLPSEELCLRFIAALPKKLMVFCRLLFETGCRSGEAVQVEWRNVNRENCTVHIAFPEKGSSERTVQI